jgi:hypothetical protein
MFINFIRDAFYKLRYPRFMKVFLDDYEEDLRVLDLGCGINKCKNGIGIDLDLDSSADILADLSQNHLPIKDITGSRKQITFSLTLTLSPIGGEGKK